MKSFILLVLLAFVFSSCKTYKNLTKSESITPQLLASLEPERKYLFELKNGTRQVVKVTQVKDSTITGLIYNKTGKGEKWSDYSATFGSMQTGVARISVSKVNPYLTGAGILVVVALTTVIIWSSTSW